MNPPAIFTFGVLYDTQWIAQLLRESMEEWFVTIALVRMIEMVKELLAIHRREEVSLVRLTPLLYLFFRW